jgi:hypothetical protein
MIALQARNPQIADPSRQTAQFANMMNMARQAEAAQLQGQRIRQEMDFARAGEDRAIQTQQASMREKDQSFMVNDMKRLRNIGVAVLGSRSEEGYQSWVDMVEATDPQLGATIRQVAPTFNPDIMNYLITEADKYIDKNIPQRTSKSEFDANGNLIIIDQGGFDPAKIRAGVITDQPDMARPQSVPPATPTAAAGTSMRATRGANTTPQDLMDQGMDPRNIPSGMPTSPASFTRGGMAGAGAVQMTPEVAQQIVDTAVKTGMMAQADFDQLMALAPEQNKQPFMDMIRANNITLQPDGMGQRPQSQFADLRGPAPQSQTAGLRGAPPMEQTLAQYQVGQQVKGRNPNMAPYPGSAQVSPNIIRGQAAAEEGGKQDVRVGAEPVIAGKTKTAQLRAEKDASFSDAQSQFDAAYTTVNNRLSDIKRFIAHPAARRVIGPLDAFTPNFGRARGAQQIYDTLVASATFDALQEMRINSPTGGALGNVSDADIRLLKESIGALGQAQNEEDFFESLRIYEERLKQVRDRLVNRYRQSYGYRLGKDWKPPVTSSQPRTPTKGGRKAGGFTVTEVDE